MAIADRPQKKYGAGNENGGSDHRFAPRPKLLQSADHKIRPLAIMGTRQHRQLGLLGSRPPKRKGLALIWHRYRRSKTPRRRFEAWAKNLRCGQSAPFPRLAHSIQKSFGITLRNTNRAESYCCFRALSDGVRYSSTRAPLGH